MLKEKFTLTEQHLKLMKRIYVTYNDGCEFGAPEINPKRPYGNSDVFNDMGEILGIPKEGIDDDWDQDEDAKIYSEEQEEMFMKLHEEMTIALQVILYSQSFKLGLYESDPYRSNWEWVREA